MRKWCIDRLTLQSIPLIWILVVMSGCGDLGSDVMMPGAPPPSPSTVSFKKDITPIFDRYGCTSCHGGNGGLYVQTVAQLKQGGDHGPAVKPGDSAHSILIGKFSTPPIFGDRMPQGVGPLPDSIQLVIRRWIDEGAQDN
jgi:hypothetical protein